MKLRQTPLLFQPTKVRGRAALDLSYALHPSGPATPPSTSGTPRPTPVKSFTPVSVLCLTFTLTFVPVGTPNADRAEFSENASTRVPDVTGSPSLLVFFVDERMLWILLRELSTHSTAPAGRARLPCRL